MNEPAPWAGVWIAEDIEQIVAAVERDSWVTGGLAVAGAGLDGLALAVDPLGSLLGYGIAWLIEHVKPLSEALDWLAGDAAQVAAHALVWRNAATSLAAEADSLAGAVRGEAAGWSGSAADAYRQWAGRREQSVRALARASEAMGAMTEGAGALVGTVRLMVRDAVAVVVSRLIVYAGELLATAGLATPLVIGQVATLCASWGARIAGWLRDLIASLRKLLGEGERLGRLITAIRNLLSERSGGGGKYSAPEGKSEPPRDPDVPEAPQPPAFHDPEIDSGKIASYAMNPDHPVGGHKYRVINSATGFGPEDAVSVEQQIRDGVRSGAPMEGKADQYGQRWAVDVPLTGPSGTIVVRTAWILDIGETRPRLVTISFPK